MGQDILSSLFAPINRLLVRRISRYYKVNNTKEISENHLRYIMYRSKITIYAFIMYFGLIAYYSLFRNNGEVTWFALSLVLMIFVGLVFFYYHGIRIQVTRMDSYLLIPPRTAEFLGVKSPLDGMVNYWKVLASFQNGGKAVQFDFVSHGPALHRFKAYQKEGRKPPPFRVWVNDRMPNWQISELDEDFELLETAAEKHEEIR